MKHLKHLKTFEFYDTEDLMSQFKDWIGDKLGIEIVDYLGSGENFL